VDYRWWTQMNLKGKTRIIPHGKPEIWYHLIGAGPIFREVG
jgi:hypothetical protein